MFCKWLPAYAPSGWTKGCLAEETSRERNISTQHCSSCSNPGLARSWQPRWQLQTQGSWSTEETLVRHLATPKFLIPPPIAGISLSEQCFPKCGAQTSSISITWKLCTSTKFGPYFRPAKSEILWTRPSNLCFNFQVILMLKLENHSLQALILIRYVLINGVWMFRVGLMGAGGK